MSSNQASWDDRKISRVRAELARSKSLAANYDHK